MSRLSSDTNLVSAISIGRRLQDPLSEYVKGGGGPFQTSYFFPVALLSKTLCLFSQDIVLPVTYAIRYAPDPCVFSFIDPESHPLFPHVKSENHKKSCATMS
jgi:hypothetical protein